MKLLFMIGAPAVGKMTVGEELAKITKLKLFHNHMTIEPVIEIFGKYDGKTRDELRDVIFRNFAASDNYGMIFTFLWAFDEKDDWEYIEHIKSIFKPYDSEFYYVELIASQEVRLERNTTENRLAKKASKRGVDWSRNNLIGTEERHRCVSYEGEIPFDNYLRIDNTNLSAADAARLIKETFDL
ncbi:MAG: AAA family ATPase [Clostridia bacterium]|nr:AAA family ATPase [Clostridia bacterium]